MWAFLNNTLRRIVTKKRSGETLLEILIALFVLTTTSGAATFLIIQSNRTSQDIQRNFQARYLSREAFEHLKMIRDTNWIRFANKSCWDIEFAQKDCPKQSPKRIVNIAPDDKRAFTLVSGKPGDMYFHLNEVTDPQAFTNCSTFTALQNPYYVYTNQTEGLYKGIMYSPDPLPPADQVPLFCRQVVLTRRHDDAIKVEVNIAWKIGTKYTPRTYTSYLLNY